MAVKSTVLLALLFVFFHSAVVASVPEVFSCDHNHDPLVVDVNRVGAGLIQVLHNSLGKTPHSFTTNVCVRAFPDAQLPAGLLPALEVQLDPGQLRRRLQEQPAPLLYAVLPHFVKYV